jgi:hypothetical protein
MATVTNGTRTEARSAPAPVAPYAEVPQKGRGWILFATIMFVVAATLSAIWGVAALSNSEFFVGNASFMLSGLHTWGWIQIGFAALEALAALSIWRGGWFGRWFGIAVAAFAFVAAMMSIPAYPLWSLTLVAIYTLVIYALAAYGGKPELTA